MSVITVTRRYGPAWHFTKQPNGHWECKQRKYTYRIMFDDPATKPIWIGLVFDKAIVTVEDRIGAQRVIFHFGYYTFDP